MPGARELASSLWIGGDIGELAELVSKDLPDIRLILGCLSWLPAQLSIDLECGAWVHARSRESDSGDIRDLTLAGFIGRPGVWHSALSAAGLPALAALARTLAIDRGLAAYVRRCVQANHRRQPSYLDKRSTRSA